MAVKVAINGFDVLDVWLEQRVWLSNQRLN